VVLTIIPLRYGLTLEGHGHHINDMELLLDGRLLSSVSADGTLKIWNTGTGECEGSIPVNTFGLTRIVAQLHDGRLVVYDTNDNAFIVGK
jgi:WD40 repeat protein